MTDTRRSDRTATAADVHERDRDARVEHLLLTGLDHYFAGQHELAISVWTRVLFLDHGHARARAYMERARSALAERQREGDELLHTGVEAFARGDGAAARRLLTSAVERGAASEEALALLERLTRLQPVSGSARPPRTRLETPASSVPDVPSGHSERPRSRVGLVAIGGAVGAAAAIVATLLWVRAASPTLGRTGTASAGVVLAAEPLPLPAVSEVVMSRAHALQGKGRLHEALVVLDAITRGDASWQDAQVLRAAIQRQLRAGFGTPLPLPGPAAPSLEPPR